MLISVLKVFDKRFKIKKLCIQDIKTLKNNIFYIKVINYLYFLIRNKCLKTEDRLERRQGYSHVCGSP